MFKHKNADVKSKRTNGSKKRTAIVSEMSCTVNQEGNIQNIDIHSKRALEAWTALHGFVNGLSANWSGNG